MKMHVLTRLYVSQVAVALVALTSTLCTMYVGNTICFYTCDLYTLLETHLSITLAKYCVIVSAVAEHSLTYLCNTEPRGRLKLRPIYNYCATLKHINLEIKCSNCKVKIMHKLEQKFDL
jgi:hypothetical protein